MKNPFEIGDRIVCTKTGCKDHKGTVLYVGEYSLQVGFDDGPIVFISPKTCRRLVKKKKPKRERNVIWVEIHKVIEFIVDWHTVKPNTIRKDCKLVKFIEVNE